MHMGLITTGVLWCTINFLKSAAFVMKWLCTPWQGSFETPFQCEMPREPCNIYINTRKIYWHNHVNAVCCSRMGPAPHQGDRFFQNMRYACWVYFRRSLPSLATVEFKFSRKSMKLARPCSCHAHVWILHHTSFKYSRLNLDLTLQQRCEVIFVCLFGWVLVI